MNEDDDLIPDEVYAARSIAFWRNQSAIMHALQRAVERQCDGNLELLEILGPCYCVECLVTREAVEELLRGGSYPQ